MRSWIAGVLMCLPLSVMAQVQLDGPVTAGLFATDKKEFKEGERVLLRSEPTIVEQRQIPARLGSKFGVRFSLRGKTEGDEPLTFMYLTPTIVTPDGMHHDRAEVLQRIVPHTQHEIMAYEFTESHEVVTGTWRFLVFQGSRKLLEEHFEVQ